MANQHQYQLSTGLTVIAECLRCGRGFVSLAPDTKRDPYLPQTRSQTAFPNAPCGGEIVLLPESVPVPASPGEKQG